MNVELIKSGLRNPAVFLSISRAVAALALLYLVPNEMWGWALGVFVYAISTDIFDGPAAKDNPHPWNGKLMNDIPSGILSWTAPGSLVLWLYLTHPDADSPWDSGWFWRWVGLGAFFVFGTLVLNSWKSAKRLQGKTGPARQKALDDMVRAEVAQGWFYGLLMLAFALQLWHLTSVERFGLEYVGSGDYWLGLALCVILAFVAGSYAKHRWTDRPETRERWAIDRADDSARAEFVDNEM